MAHQALYREWRPKIFDEVVEQKHAVYALRQSVISRQIGHAYLFSGTRGTGKTTLAKIFARAINCLNPIDGNPCNQCAICRGMLDGSLLDIVEMDAASNNSVDNIRRICDEVVFMPSLAKFKVYIIDEVHMLSTGAFNALLKTLEEPPAHAVFILATTEPYRIPATILSRCQRYEFRRIPVVSLIGRLAEIAAADGIDISDEALQTIASLADGAMRDAISMLDQAKASFPGRIDRDDVLGLAGIVQDEFLQQMAEVLVRGEAAVLLELIDQLVMAGRDLARFVIDLAQHLRNILICQVSANPHLLVRVATDTWSGMQQLAGQISSDTLIDLIKGLSALLTDLRWAADSRTALEIGLIRLMTARPETAVIEKPAVSVISKPAVKSLSSPVKTEQLDNTTQTATLKENSESIIMEKTADEELPDVDQGGPETAATAPNPDNSALALKLWSEILDHLLNEGHMTLYLFCRPVQPQLAGNHLRLLFSAADSLNFQEVNTAANIKILKAAASRLIGSDITILAILDGKQQTTGKSSTPEVTTDSWIDKMKKTADTLGIPLKVEE